MCSLVKALGTTELKEPCLAAVAEYREGFLRSRPRVPELFGDDPH